MSYHGRCIGRVIEFLDKMCGCTLAYESQFIYDDKTQTGTATYVGQPLVTYTWKDNTDIPVFEFQGKYDHFNRQQRQSLQETIEELGWWELDPDDKFEGTTNMFIHAYHGKYFSAEQKQKIEDDCVAARKRKHRDENFGDYLLEQLELNRETKEHKQSGA